MEFISSSGRHAQFDDGVDGEAKEQILFAIASFIIIIIIIFSSLMRGKNSYLYYDHPWSLNYFFLYTMFG